jgi:CheY-like chemotaxis protein
LARKILLADDSVTAQNMGRKILTDAGYDVVTVNNGSAALKRAAEIKPDLIVLDVYMPGYSGLEVCQRLKDATDTAHIPVLLTVGKLEPFKAEEGRRVRADNHIIKPFEASELLSAITRLEDHIVAHPPAERLAGKGNHRAESNPEADAGWKSRLTFSAKKKKDEPEEALAPSGEEVTADAGFRDFRKANTKTNTKTKPSASVPAVAKAPSPALRETPATPHVVPEAPANIPSDTPGYVPSQKPINVSPEVSLEVPPEVPTDVPTDITPEELDALSAVASKLNRRPFETEHETELETEFATEPATRNDAEASLAASVATSGEESIPVVEPVPIVEKDTTVQIPAFSVEGKSEVEIPVECVELAGVAAAPTVDPGEIGTQSHVAYPETERLESQSRETQAASETQAAPETQSASETQAAESPVAVAVNTALLAEDAAPIDRDDEPTFAFSVTASDVIDKIKIEEKPAEVIATAESSEKLDAIAHEQTAKATDREPQLAVSQSDGQSNQQSDQQSDDQSDEFKSRESAVAVSAATSPLAEEAAPSDAELVEALRLLTPSLSDSSSTPSTESLVAAGQLLAEQAALTAASGPRWIAEPITPSPEESALSLETEMAMTLAATPAPAANELIYTEAAGASAIAAAVENRLAEANFTGGTNAPAASEIVGEPVGKSVELSAPETSAPSGPEPSAIESATIEPATIELAAVSSSDGQIGNEIQTDHAAEEAPKAMAAAAGDGSPTSAATTDASTIASIVDSVMADLRPKIVEEIAKKLAGK